MAPEDADNDAHLQRQRQRYRRNKAAQRRRARERAHTLEQQVMELTRSFRRAKTEVNELKTKAHMGMLLQSLMKKQLEKSVKHTHRVPSEEIVTQFGQLFKNGAPQTQFWATHSRTVEVSLDFLTLLNRFDQCHETFYLAQFQLQKLIIQNMIRFDGMVHMTLTRAAIDQLHGNQLCLEAFVGSLLKVPLTMDFYFDANNLIQKIRWEWNWVQGFLPILTLKQISTVLLHHSSYPKKS